MIKFISLLIGIASLVLTIDLCQALNDTDSLENITEIIPPKPFVYYGRYHQRRSRRESPNNNITSVHEPIATILSILPLDRLGAIIGQMMATGVKEMLNPNVGKKVINIFQNQAPSLLTSLFTNLYSTLRAPPRSSTRNMTVPNNRNVYRQLSNSSILSAMIQSRKK